MYHASSAKIYHPVSTLDVLTIVTGHPNLDQMGDLRYLSEPLSRGNWQFRPLSPEEIRNLIKKHRRLFFAAPGGPIVRLPAETIRVRGGDGIVRERRTGTISEAYVDHVLRQQGQGKTIFERVVIGIKEIRNNHGQHLAQPHGTIIPLTLFTHLKAKEMGLTAAMESAAARSILSRVLRESIPRQPLARRAIKTMTSPKKVGRSVAGHNLVVAPHPRLLAQIQRTGVPVDKAMETAARQAMERMERKRGAKITAVCSTHLYDSTGVRPHLHIRMSAYDSTGKYIRLFDRKTGGSGGNRCLLQPEIEREIRKTIERWEQRGRD
jgi:hypothetical protein